MQIEPYDAERIKGVMDAAFESRATLQATDMAPKGVSQALGYYPFRRLTQGFA